METKKLVQKRNKMFKATMSGGLTGLLLLLLVGLADAAVIVDTGSADYGVGYAISYGSVAARFTLDRDYIITGVESYIWNTSDSVSDVTCAIFSDVNDVPAAALYSSEFSVPVTPGSWYGVAGESWSLTAGSYWALFDSSLGGTSLLCHGVSNPCDLYAYNHPTQGWGTWQPTDTNAFALRVTAAVPIPSTMLLLGTGLAGLAAFRKKFRK